MAASYLGFYQLSELPFSLTSDPRFAFDSRGYAQAVADATVAVGRREGVVVITGGPGTGKTLLCRALIESLGAETRLTAVPSPFVGAEELLGQIVDEVSPDRPDELEQQLRLLAAHGTHSVVVIDEAQHLNAEVLEQIRVLSNLEDEGGRLLQIILVGQPDLRTRLAREAPLLDQRVARRCALQPMAPDEVGAYIAHRLAVAGGVPDELSFSADAIPLIARLSRGIPRIVNQVCDRALEVAAERRVRWIERPVIQAAAEGLDLSHEEPDTAPTSRTTVLVGIAAVLGVVALGLWLWFPRGPGRRTSAPEPGTSASAPAPSASGRPAASVQTPSEAAPAGAPLVAKIAEADSVLVDVADFRDGTQAQKAVDDLMRHGLPGFSRFDAQRRVHNVVVGPYVSRDEALEAKKQMDALNYAKARIRIEPPR